MCALLLLYVSQERDTVRTKGLSGFHFEARRELGRTGFVASVPGIGDLADRSCVVHSTLDSLPQTTYHPW